MNRRDTTRSTDRGGKGSRAIPTTERGRQSRDRIIQAAADLIHLQGVAATSVDEVLKKSGAGKSQFYHYFRNKEDLVHAVLEFRMEGWRSDLLPVLEKLDRWDGIRLWFDTVIRLQEESGFRGGCPVGSLAAERSEGDDGFRLRLAEALRVKGDFLRKGLLAMKNRGELQPDADPDRLAHFVIAVLQGALLMASVEKGRATLEVALDEAFRHLSSHAATPDDPQIRSRSAGDQTASSRVQ